MRKTPRHRIRSFVAAGVLAALLAAGHSTADAALGSTDYTVTLTSGLYEAAPPEATVVTAGGNVPVALPFSFPYFGEGYSTVRITWGGYLQFGAGTNGSWQQAPLDISNVPSGASYDGVCAVLWDTFSGETWKTWTAGLAPNRRFIVEWAGAYTNQGGAGNPTMFEVKLFEGSGRIEFAYGAPSAWNGIHATIGMVAPGADPRWIVPVTLSTNQTGRPANDYRFDPRTVKYTGRLTSERFTPTAAGLGTTTTTDPLGGLPFEVRNSSGAVSARGTTDADGNFAVDVAAGIPGNTTQIWVSSQNSACLVKPATGSVAHSIRIANGLGYVVDTDVGPVSLDAGTDPGAVFRGPANIARAVKRAFDWASTMTTTAIPPLTIQYDAASTVPTVYVPATMSTAPLLLVGGPATVNPDLWDDGVLIRTYMRYVLASIAPKQPSSVDDRFDAVTEKTNAFAHAFGCAAYSQIDGRTQLIDSTDASTAVVYDFESPTITSPAEIDVAGRVAGVLFDLVDPANETTDWVDGSGAAAARVFQIVDAMTVAPDATEFAKAWAAAGYDMVALSRCYVGHGLLTDDALEPNDAAAESSHLGAGGVRRDGSKLNVGNEDWFDFDAASALDGVRAEMAFPRTTFVTTVELQLVDAMGAVIAGHVDSGLGPVVVDGGDLPAGTYRIRVRHASGDVVGAYTVQASSRLRVDRTPLRAWTVGIPFEQAIVTTGGIAPHSFVVQSGTAPIGLAFSAANQRVSGTPVTVGAYDFTLALRDGGNPVHEDLVTHHVVINDALAFDFGEFVPFAAAKNVNRTRAHVGGTSPLAVSLASGALPAGISLAADDFRFTGMAAAAGSTTFSVHGIDVAGSAHDATATAVVCVAIPAPKSVVALAAGASACGYFVDCVAGSRLSIAVGTAPKQVKRVLRAALLGPDGLPVDGAKVKGGAGKASLSVASAPVTGRYYAVVASDAGDATQLVGSTSVAPPKKGAGSFDGVTGGSLVDVRLGALDGAKLTLKAVGDKKAALTATVIALFAPDGAPVPLAGLVTQKGSASILATTLTASGTWTVRIRAAGSNAGRVAYSFGLAEPKGVTFSAD